MIFCLFFYFLFLIKKVQFLAKSLAERVGFEPTVPLAVHTLSKCALNLGLIKQYLFNIETSKIGLDCNQSEARFLTQIWSQIVVGFSYEKTFRDRGSGLFYN